MRRFRKSVVVAGFLAGGSSGALAADLPSHPQPYRPVAVAAAPFSWTGFYVGVNAGYGLARTSTDNGVFVTTADPKGFIGGGQAGFNWQTGNIVLGVEADIDASGQKADVNQTFTVFGTPFLLNYTAKLDWFGTVRGRVGFAADKWLIFGTGGFAYGHGSASGTSTVLGVTAPFSMTQQRTGWTGGGGIEGALGNNFSVRAEYLYIDFGAKNDPVLGASVKVTNHVARAALNYRFGL